MTDTEALPGCPLPQLTLFIELLCVFIPLKHLPSLECPSLTPHLLPQLPIYLLPCTAVLLKRGVYIHVASPFPYLVCALKIS